MEERAKKLKEALKKIGIRNETDLREAIAALPPLNLAIMTAPLKYQAPTNG